MAAMIQKGGRREPAATVLGKKIQMAKKIKIDVTFEPFERSKWNLVGAFIPTRAIFYILKLLQKSNMAAMAAILDFSEIFKSM
jgi:hypothetical protein